MIAFRRLSRDEMAQRHAAARKPGAAATSAPRPVRTGNVRAILDLGNLVFHTFQGRAYGVPPLPYKVGQRIAQLRADAQTAAPDGLLTLDNMTAYNAAINPLPALLWRHSVPVGRLRGLLHRLGLLANPFRRATERELVELADFFLQLRMKSSVQSLPGSRSLARQTR